MSHITAILLGGGLGRRMASSTPKQFLPLAGKPVILHSFELFLRFSEIKEIIIVCDHAYQHLFDHPLVKFAKPGAERQDSVFNGACLASPDSDRLLIHDGARPCLEYDLLDSLLKEAQNHLALALAVPVTSTIKQTNCDGFVEKTLNRTCLWEIQTPQIIEPSLYKQAALLAQSQNLVLTDDVSLVELLGHPVKLVKGSYKNIKITTPEDLVFCNTLFSHAHV